MEFKEQLDQVLQKTVWARQQEEALRAQLFEAERTREFWEIFSQHLSNDHPASVLLALRRNPSYLQRVRATENALHGLLEQIRLESESRAREAAKRFTWSFPTAVREAGIQPDKSSRHPHYTFREGFIRLDVAERDFTARILPRDGQEILLGMDVGPLVQTLVAEEARIFRRQFQPEQLLRSVYTAYIACLKAERRPEGDELPLRRVVNRLAKNLNRFATDEFNVDFAQVIKSGRLAIDGQTMHLNHTRQARVGMLLHGLEEGGYVGFVSFKKEDQSR